ncbi:MAG: glycosyltransferase family 9 protein [Ignavibacterium sp.]|nr:MAG: glycosyltransferase family 9 protein [Ignavibacterium sp.]
MRSLLTNITANHISESEPKISRYRFTFLLNRIPILQKLLNIAVYPLFFLVRLLRKFRREEGKSIVIVSLHRLGDTVFTIPAIKEIIKHYDRDIYIVCSKQSELIYSYVFPELNYRILCKNDFILDGRLSKGKTRKLFNNLKPKTIFDLTRSVQSAFLIFNSPARELIGANDEHFRAIYTNFTTIRKTPHLVDAYLDVVNTKFKIENDKGIKEFKTNFNKDGKILIHPFGGWAAKEWELDKFILLAEKLHLEYSVEIIVPPNSINSQAKLGVDIQEIPISETNSITDLIDKIKECSLFIGNDTGPLYIASMVGKPTFTIYGPTNPDYSIPFGDNHKFISKIIGCSPEKNKQYCFTHAGRVGCPAFKCMELLDVDEVYNKLLPFIQKHCNKKFMNLA